MSGTQWSQWIVATLIAAISLGFMGLNWVYPRTEGELLSKRMDRLEDTMGRTMQSMSMQLERVETMILELYKQDASRQSGR